MSGSAVAALRFRNGESATFPRSVAERIFNRGVIEADTGSDIMVWADGAAEIDLGPDLEIDGLSCERFSSVTFLERLRELADEAGLVVMSYPPPIIS